MRNPTENVFKELNKFLSSLENPPQDEKELQKILDDFIPKYNAEIEKRGSLTEENAKTADDFLDLADEADSKKKALEYVKKACELDKNNIEAQAKYIALTAKDGIDTLNRYKKLLVKAEKQLKAEEIWTEDSIGHFWDIMETRTYMRLYLDYMRTLMLDGRLKQAEAACQEMLKLNPTDNLGIRYELMHIYAMLEDEKGAKKLFKKYRGETSVQFLMPFSLLYYKIGDEEEAEKILKEAVEDNPEIPKFLRTFGTALFQAQMALSTSRGYYSPGTMEEIFICLDDHEQVYSSTPTFFTWGKRILKGVRTPRKKK